MQIDKCVLLYTLAYDFDWSLLAKTSNRVYVFVQTIGGVICQWFDCSPHQVSKLELRLFSLTKHQNQSEY